MTMTFFQHDSIGPNGGVEKIEPGIYYPNDIDVPATKRFHILREKLRVPETGEIIGRPRITELLTKSLGQFPATLIAGRAGTGKTALAASFAFRNDYVSWYTLESTDVEWLVFSQYFSACLSETVYGPSNKNREKVSAKKISATEIARFLINRFSSAYAGPFPGSSLIVLDDIHHIFDSAWFEDFFNLLLYSLPPNTHLLLLCRSKPPCPLWRLRSKQMLNVMDEKVIAFTAVETEALFRTIGLSSFSAKEAHRQCFGRISKVLKFAEDLSSILPPAHFQNR